MQTLPNSPNRLVVGRSGFTLVELMVSMAVLTLLVVLTAQLTNRASDTIGLSNKRLDADDAARTVFNVMATDFAGMLRRDDVDYFFFKNDGASATNPGNDSMWFYSSSASYFIGSDPWNNVQNQSPLTFVGYRVPTLVRGDPRGERAQNFVLERVGKPTVWSAPYQTHFLTTPEPTQAVPSPTPYQKSTFLGNYYVAMGGTPFTDGSIRTSEAASYIVSNQVFRMEFCFLMKDGSYMMPPPHPAAGSAEAMRKAGTEVSAVVVGLAFLDPQSRVITPNLAQAAATLPNLTAADLTASPPRLMDQKWTEVVTASDFAQKSGLPPAAASQVRVYQRAFPLSE